MSLDGGGAGSVIGFDGPGKALGALQGYVERQAGGTALGQGLVQFDNNVADFNRQNPNLKPYMAPVFGAAQARADAGAADILTKDTKAASDAAKTASDAAAATAKANALAVSNALDSQGSALRRSRGRLVGRANNIFSGSSGTQPSSPGLGSYFQGKTLLGQ